MCSPALACATAPMWLWVRVGPRHILAVDVLPGVARVWPLADHMSTWDHSLPGGEGKSSSRDKTRVKVFQKTFPEPKSLTRGGNSFFLHSYCSRSFSGKAISLHTMPPTVLWVQISHPQESMSRGCLPSGWPCGCRASHPGPLLASPAPASCPLEETLPPATCFQSFLVLWAPWDGGPSVLPHPPRTCLERRRRMQKPRPAA